MGCASISDVIAQVTVVPVSVTAPWSGRLANDWLDGPEMLKPYLQCVGVVPPSVQLPSDMASNSGWVTEET